MAKMTDSGRHIKYHRYGQVKIINSGERFEKEQIELIEKLKTNKEVPFSSNLI